MPATAIAARAASRALCGTACANVARTSAASASSSAGVGGSVVRWRSLWRTTPACVETWKLTSSPLPTTSSVEPPPTSMTTVGVVSPGARRWSRRGR